MCSGALQVGPIVARMAERVVDADAGVRKQSMDLFRQRIFSGLAENALQPFLPVIMAHVHSGLTQMAADLRCGTPHPVLLSQPRCFRAMASTQAAVRLQHGLSTASQSLRPLLA